MSGNIRAWSMYIFFLGLAAVGVCQTVSPASTSATHSLLVQKAILASQEPQLKVGKTGKFDKDQSDRILDRFYLQYSHALTEGKIAEQQNEQGGLTPIPDGLQEMRNVQIRYVELYPSLSDDTLYPITNSVITYAPESTFAGIDLYSGKGKFQARVTSKAKKWYSGVTEVNGGVQNNPSYYKTLLLKEDGSIATNGFYSDIYVKWGDIKNKIAFDATDKKLAEDHQMEVDALTRSQ